MLHHVLGGALWFFDEFGNSLARHLDILLLEIGIYVITDLVDILVPFIDIFVDRLFNDCAHFFSHNGISLDRLGRRGREDRVDH